jgi:hypothetical protein
MDVDADACTVESDPLRVLEAEGSSGHLAGDMPVGHHGMDVDDSAESMTGKYQGQLTEPHARRNESERADSRLSTASVTDEVAGQVLKMGVADEPLYTLDALSDTEALSVLNGLAVAMFTGGAEATVVFDALKRIAGLQTVRVWKLVKHAIHDLYESKAHRDAICRSPERPDLRLAQEEAQGLLAGAVFAIELLASEARAAGRNVGHAAAAEKKAAAVKEPWKTQRRRAREAAAKDPALEAALEQMLAEIQAAEGAAKAKRLGELYPIQLPAANTIIHEPRPPTAVEVVESAAAKLRRLRAAVVAAEEAVVLTDADAAAGKRLVARAKEAMKAASARRSEAVLSFWPEGGHKGRKLAEVSEEVWQAARQLQDEISTEAVQAEACWKECALEHWACDEAHADALEALEAARDAVAAQERLQARQAERERTEAEWKAMQAQWECERAEATARMETLSLRSTAAKECAERAQLETISARHPGTYAFETPAETRVRLLVDAERAWSTPPAQCKVVSLIGVSPAGACALAEQYQ